MVRCRKPTRRRPRPCTMVQLVSLGLDLNLAVSTSLARVDCDLTKDSTSAVVAGLTVPDRSRDNVPATCTADGNCRSINTPRLISAVATRCYEIVLRHLLASFVIYRINSSRSSTDDRHFSSAERCTYTSREARWPDPSSHIP